MEGGAHSLSGLPLGLREQVPMDRESLEGRVTGVCGWKARFGVPGPGGFQRADEHSPDN